MRTPLLETKLYRPGSRPGLVPRPRLIERLDRGAASKLTLVSAPAGFGKSRLLAEWLAGTSASAGEDSAAWLALDSGDNDPVTFWSYVVAALRTVAPGVGANELELLASPQPPPIQMVLTTLLNDVGATGSDIVLVLDDYHLVDSREIQDAMAFLLDHLPPRLHLVIASRADPAVPLARLRARGELVEVRAADLRFTPDEAAAYLNEVMGLELTAADVAALEGRTEGWIAALQLAALSMQGRDDVAGFIAGFAGDDRYIVDYLAEEVLQRQPDQVRDFLLHTSVLDRLNGPLCDAVTGQGGGKAMLETLDRGNLFLVALDDRRQWYRYHHLFADVLRARLTEASPELVDVLHRRASDWFADHDEPSEAIRHAIAGHQFDRAAELVELTVPTLLRDRQEALLRGWIELLPEELLRSGRCSATATSRHCCPPEPSRGSTATCSTPSAGSTGRTQVRRPRAHRPGWSSQTTRSSSRLPAGTAVHRAGLSLVLGDLPGTVAHAQRALDLFEEDDDVGRGAATALIGIASWTGGDLEAAHEAYAECTARLRRAGHLSDVLGVLDHAGGHPDHPGPAARRDAHLRAGPAGRSRPRAGRAGAARDTLTCTSG